MKKIAIIGGGVAGLTAGIEAASRGFESVIYERHSLVGGQCTGWDRAGYHIDGCIHWLTGTKDGTELNGLWRDVGALSDDVGIIQLDDFGKVDLGDTTITIWKDLDRFERELIAIGPEDVKHVKALMRAIRAAQSMPMPARVAPELLSPGALIKLIFEMARKGSIMRKYASVTASQYAARYRNPVLRQFFSTRVTPGYSFYIFPFSLAVFTSGNGAIPEGGSREMALRMEKRYVSLGGRVVKNAVVEEIVVEGDVAVGVRLAGDRIERADYIVASCDVHLTLEQLLKGKYRDREFDKRFSDPVSYNVVSSVQVALGVNADMKDYPLINSFGCKPFTCGKTQIYGLGYKGFSYEPSFAPAGHSVLVLELPQDYFDYEFWEPLAKDREAYRAEKERLAREVVLRMEGHFPELTGKITALDVATPSTYHRYTGAWKGAWMAFMPSPGSKGMMHSGKIKGLTNCYLTGQWLMPPGGLPCAAMTGRFAVQRIAKKEGQKIR